MPRVKILKLTNELLNLTVILRDGANGSLNKLKRVYDSKLKGIRYA